MTRQEFMDAFRNQDFLDNKSTVDDRWELVCDAAVGSADFTVESVNDILSKYDTGLRVHEIGPMEQSFEYVLKYFPKYLLDIAEFNKQHRIELIMGADWQMQCIIDGKCYGTGLNTLEALLIGYLQYIKHNKNDNSRTILATCPQ